MKHSDEERAHAYKIFHHLSNRDIFEEGEAQPSGAEETGFKFHETSDVVLNVQGSFHARFSHPVDIW